MRQQIAIAITLAILPLAAGASWVVISSDPGKRVEIDPGSLRMEESGSQIVTGRVLFEHEIFDARSSANYRSIETVSRYDCESRAHATLHRIWRKADGEILRAEEIKNPVELPVRSGSIDDKLLREVCRPQSRPAASAGGGASGSTSGKASALQVAEKANAAAKDLRRANEAMVNKEVQKAAGSNAKAPPAATAAKTPATGSAPASAATTSKSPVKEVITEAVKIAGGDKAVPAKAAVGNVATAAAVAGGKTPAANAPAAKETVEKVAAGKAAPAATPASKAPADSSKKTAATPPRSLAHVHWSYAGEGGPENWGRLKPEYAACAKGKRQSPINIQDGIRVDQPPIEFAWNPSTFRIVDNGHTVQVAVGGSSIALLGKTYELVDFHFHRPAEERVNGRGFEMVAHFVHKAADGRLAVVAVLIERGGENPFIQTLWNYLPLEQQEVVAPPGVVIDPARFLPAERGYYTYMGSLTTPPCTENVQWLVLKKPVQLSAEQIAIFSRLYNDNARPVQPAFGRLIKESR